jgi:hypothetical protein
VSTLLLSRCRARRRAHQISRRVSQLPISSQLRAALAEVDAELREFDQSVCFHYHTSWGQFCIRCCWLALPLYVIFTAVGTALVLVVNLLTCHWVYACTLCIEVYVCTGVCALPARICNVCPCTEDCLLRRAVFLTCGFPTLGPCASCLAHGCHAGDVTDLTTFEVQIVRPTVGPAARRELTRMQHRQWLRQMRALRLRRDHLHAEIAELQGHAPLLTKGAVTRCVARASPPESDESMVLAVSWEGSKRWIARAQAVITTQRNATQRTHACPHTSTELSFEPLSWQTQK